MLISLSQAIEPVGEYTTESVTHGQCDARPTVTFPTNGRYQFILLGEQRHIVCKQLVESRYVSGAAGTRTCDVSVVSLMPPRYTTLQLHSHIPLCKFYLYVNFLVVF